MSHYKIMVIIILGLSCAVGLAAFVKKQTASSATISLKEPIKIALSPSAKTLKPAPPPKTEKPVSPPPPAPPLSQAAPSEKEIKNPQPSEQPPEINRIDSLFNKEESRFPIVETITYKSHVPWQTGRPAWLSDYANHYKTHIHFIARSINGTPNYLKQEITEGGKFNVLRTDKNFRFHLIVDTSRCKLWLYYVDLDINKNELIKSYSTCLGRVDPSKTSGLLTPLGTYSLGSRTAIYDSKIKGNYRGKTVVMKTVFGTRWIPFDKEIGSCTLPAKGFGIHGVPWKEKEDSSELIEEINCLGRYESDGCIRMSTSDIEEIFAIITTRPTHIEIVRNFFESSLAKE